MCAVFPPRFDAVPSDPSPSSSVERVEVFDLRSSPQLTAGHLTNTSPLQGPGDESLRPVTIKQIIDAEQAFTDAPFRIDGIEVNQITFVGMIRSITAQTTNITFKLDDGTGTVEVKQWVDADKPDESKPSFTEDQYVRVWGRLRSFHNRRHVGSHFIKPVTDFSEVNYHLLEATYVHLFFTKGAPAGADAGANGNAADDDSMFVDGGSTNDHAKLASCSARARKFFSWLQNAEGGNEGLHLNVIAQGTGMSVNDAMAASEELIGPGLIYTTVDDETFAILDY
jgi:replication factor A2